MRLFTDAQLAVWCEKFHNRSKNRISDFDGMKYIPSTYCFDCHKIVPLRIKDE